jgi:putative phosphoesterase
MIRLGIISDTHYPTRIPTLPYDALEDAFRNVDAILHAGDIETRDVLNHLAGIAPVVAVKGDDDHFDLPLERVLEIGGIRIGLTHGHRHPLIEEFYRIRRRFGYSGRKEMLGRLDGLLRRFDDSAIDVLVFGHSHMPLSMRLGRVLLFNPGAVYVMSLDSARWQLPREKNLIRRQILKQYLSRYQHYPTAFYPRSTVGILEIHDNRTTHAQFVDLPLIDHYSTTLQLEFA